MSTIYRPDEWDIAADHEHRLNQIESGCPPFIVPPSTDFQNGWNHAGAPYQDWGYRVCDGALELKGHLMPGSSGTVAYTFPLAFLSMLSGIPTWPTDIVNGAGFSIARIHIDNFSGDMTITYPVT